MAYGIMIKFFSDTEMYWVFLALSLEAKNNLANNKKMIWNNLSNLNFINS
jgi:hypothetical protein